MPDLNRHTDIGGIDWIPAQKTAGMTNNWQVAMTVKGK